MVLPRTERTDNGTIWARAAVLRRFWKVGEVLRRERSVRGPLAMAGRVGEGLGARKSGWKIELR